MSPITESQNAWESQEGSYAIAKLKGEKLLRAGKMQERMSVSQGSHWTFWAGLDGSEYASTFWLSPASPWTCSQQRSSELLMDNVKLMKEQQSIFIQANFTFVDSTAALPFLQISRSSACACHTDTLLLGRVEGCERVGAQKAEVCIRRGFVSLQSSSQYLLSEICGFLETLMN